MTVTTLAGEKIVAQKIKCNRLLQNFYKVDIYSKTTKYCSHSYTLRFCLNYHPTSLACFFSKIFNPLQLLGTMCLLGIFFFLGNTCKRITLCLKDFN